MRYAVLASRRFTGKGCQQLAEELEREREERLEAQRRAEQLEEEGIRLEWELGRSKEEPGGRRSEARPWWLAQVRTGRRFALGRLSRMVHFPGGGPESAVPLSSSLAPRGRRSFGSLVFR
jgi:hypothetical protein